MWSQKLKMKLLREAVSSEISRQELCAALSVESSVRHLVSVVKSLKALSRGVSEQFCQLKD